MTRWLTRRQFGLTAAAGAAVIGHAETRRQESGTVEASNKNLELDELDPVHWTLQRYQSAPLRMTFRATNRADAEIWQQELRAKLIELIGGFPERIPLRPETLEVRQYPGYRREKLLFQSRPGVAVIGYLLTPTGRKSPYPTVVAIPGHGRGVDDIVGIDENGHDRTDKPGYEHDFALQTVEHGLATFAIEPMAFGYRRDPRTREKGPAVAA